MTQANPPQTVLFSKLKTGDRFRWRDRDWRKTGPSHARDLNAPKAEKTFVPNCEHVTLPEEPKPPHPAPPPGDPSAKEGG